MFVDIIIPVKHIDHYIYESIPKFLNLDYEEYGIILLPDSFTNETFPKTRIIATGNIGPAQKRDLALKHSKADILAFIDDDAYPENDWLKNATRHFSDPDVGALGGPAMTPYSDSFYQKVSGAVFLSTFGGSNPERYWPVGSVRLVDDWPSVNQFIRRNLFEEIGGFNSAFWPGEDTKLCLDIIKMGKKIIYDPDVIVWHHRRGGLLRHLRQIGRYGLHRGFFAKKYPENSRKLKYFLPTLFVVFLVTGIFLPLVNKSYLIDVYYTGIGAYFLMLLAAFYQIQRKEKNFAVSFMSLPYIFLTHIWYGVRFFQGFIIEKDLKSKLRKEG